MPLNRAPVMPVVQQHAQEVALLRQVRAVHLRAPHVELHRLRRLDDRLAAHLDGLMVAGPVGLEELVAGLAEPSAGAVFALAVCALQTKDAARLTHLVSLASALPDAERGWLSALGWVSSQDLQGVARALLGSKEASHRAWGLASCAMHRVDPGAALVQAVQDPDPLVRARAWKVAAQTGHVLKQPQWVQAARQALVQDAAVSPVIAQTLAWWGQVAHEGVQAALLKPAPGQTLPDQAVHRLVVLASTPDWGREQVRALAAQAEQSKPVKRRMMRAVSWVGDVQVVPWLIHHMGDETWARLAGEVLSTITGVNLAQAGLERRPPEGFEGGPNDNPDDPDVALDEDDSLPWPDQARVQAWWAAHGGQFTPGQRYFAGQVPQRDHLIHVLKTAGQRQRIMAAEHLALLAPQQGLFPVAAPAWRQQRWLAQGAV